MNDEQKKEILENLNWDTSVSPGDLLKLVNGNVQSVGGISREAMFLRTLERIPWHCLVFCGTGRKTARSCTRQSSVGGYAMNDSVKSSTSFSEFYEENLYRLQNGVLNIVNSLSVPFYLTGGTALSRGYYHHRYSDYLDFFVNRCKSFGTHVNSVLKALKANVFFGTMKPDL